MIPVVAISNMATFLVALAITIYLFKAYQKSKEELLKYFLYFFISITILFLSIAMPFLIFKNISLITLSLIIMPSPLYLTLAFISLISLRIIKWYKIEKAYLIVLIISLLFSYLMIFINFEPVRVTTEGEFIYWYVPASRIFWQIGSVVSGIISGITMLSVTIFFFIGGLKSQEKLIRKRAFLMGGGMLFLTLAGVVNFIVGGIPNLTVHIIAALLAICGFLILFLGIVKVKVKTSIS